MMKRSLFAAISRGRCRSIATPSSCNYNHGGLVPLTYSTQVSPNWNPELIVFDKYGTLVNIHTVWTPWTIAISNRLESATGLKLQEKVFLSLDVCLFTNRIKSGILGDGTTEQIRHAIERLVCGQGIAMDEAQRVVDQCWEECSLTDHPDTLAELKKVRTHFDDIRSRGTKIVVCSSDSRRATVDALSKSDLMSLVSQVVCGDDDHVKTLPRDQLVKKICQDIGVEPRKTVVIGDTVGDMKMGEKAEVAINIGVLSGISTRLELAGPADFVTGDVFDALKLIQGLSPQDVQKMSSDRKVTVQEENPASLVIFDKDGTLLCFHSLWTPWAKQFMERLERVTGINLAGKLLPELGFSEEEDKWRPTVFTTGTTKQSIDGIVDLLVTEGMVRQEAEKAVRSVWGYADHSSQNASLLPLDHPGSIFKVLKSLGIKVAVCTSDCRHGTEEFLKDLDAIQYVDMMICGDDPDNVPKPSAHNALRICEELDVDPAQAVIVGDTSADMLMGKFAKLGATVGVLSGVGDIDHLAPDADHMVPSISHVLDVVTHREQRQSVREMYLKDVEKINKVNNS